VIAGHLCNKFHANLFPIKHQELLRSFQVPALSCATKKRQKFECQTLELIVRSELKQTKSLTLKELKQQNFTQNFKETLSLPEQHMPLQKESTDKQERTYAL